MTASAFIHFANENKTNCADFYQVGLLGSSSRQNQSTSISSYVTLRRGPGSSIARVSQKILGVEVSEDISKLVKKQKQQLNSVYLFMYLLSFSSRSWSIFPSLSQHERPKSALERLSSPTEAAQPPSGQSRGRMTAEEQLERMKRHQKALVRERKRNLSQGERSTSTVTTQRSSSSSRLPSNTSDPPTSVRYPPPPRSSSRHREHHLHCCYDTFQPPAT